MNAKKLVQSVLAGAALVAVGCGTEVVVDVDVNGTTGADIQEAFFGRGAVQNQALLISEDFDGDGNLDVNEDLDGDFTLDVDEDLNDNGVLDADEVDVDGDGVADPANEDVDGDGFLDFVNEDQNDNGVIDEIPVDINGDGVADENDVFSASAVIVVASSGEVLCEDVAAALAVEDEPTLEGTVLVVSAIAGTLGADGDDPIVEGATLEPVDSETNFIDVNAQFGKFEGGVAIDNSEAFSQDDISLTLNKFDQTLSFSLEALLTDFEEGEFALSAEVSRAVECPELSEQLNILLESGEF